MGYSIFLVFPLWGFLKPPTGDPGEIKGGGALVSNLRIHFIFPLEKLSNFQFRPGFFPGEFPFLCDPLVKETRFRAFVTSGDLYWYSVGGGGVWRPVPRERYPDIPLRWERRGGVTRCVDTRRGGIDPHRG